MMPSCDQTGVPGLFAFAHFHSSTTSGSASLMSLRILPRVFPRQSPSSAILFEMDSDADWPWLASDVFMFHSSKFRVYWRRRSSCLRDARRLSSGGPTAHGHPPELHPVTSRANVSMLANVST